MVKRYLINLLFEHGPKLFRSFSNAYRDATKDMPKGNKSNDDSFTSKLGFSNILNTPLTREEALRILNLKSDQAKPDTIMQQFDKYMEANDPEKGGSFYIQNKVYYAKEFLMQDFENELNISKFNPDMENRPPSEDSMEGKEEDNDKEENGDKPENLDKEKKI
jgi:import inner membrane translocase subunit TIM16